MNDKMTPFQMVIFGILVITIIASVLLFSSKRQNSNTKAIPITIWGTLSGDIIQSLENKINETQRDSIDINYVQVSEKDFENKLIESIALGNNPDGVILNDDQIIKNENLLYLINYDFYSQSNFKNTFIQASEILLREDGVIGLPFIVDPLVMYWNRTILNNNNISVRPEYWQDIMQITPKITIVDTRTKEVKKSTIALGEYRNIKNAKEIFATLINQAGNPIIYRDQSIEKHISILSERLGYTVAPADAALSFFVQFSDPGKSSYTWNRSLPSSEEMFLLGDLAFYIGFASERINLINKNPNLDFDIAMMPQSLSNPNNEKIVNSNLYFLAILNKTEKVSAVYDAYIKLTSSENIQYLSDIINLPPVRRDLLKDIPNIAYKDVFNKSALISRTFIDPDKLNTDIIFQEMIESIISGKNTISSSVKDAANQINILLK